MIKNFILAFILIPFNQIYVSSPPELIKSAVVGNNKQRLIGPVAKAMLNLYDADSSKIRKI
jgi:hypothetical protein